jgi:hypothetical protein
MGYMERNQSVELSGNLSVLSSDPDLVALHNAYGKWFSPDIQRYENDCTAWAHDRLDGLLRARSAASKDGNE